MEENVSQMEPWLLRLKQERTDLLERTIKLKQHIEDPDSMHNKYEWELLQRQFGLMREYLQVLTDRCVYHNLLESANLYLEYPSCKPCCGR